MASRAQAAPVTYASRGRSRGLIGQMIAALMQPGAFFRTLTQDRQWVSVAAVILIVVGFNAVRQPAVNVPAEPEIPAFDPSLIPGDPGVVIEGSGGGAPVAIPGEVPPDFGGFPGEGEPAAEETTFNDTLMIALTAAAGTLLVWAVQAVLLCLVSWLNGSGAQLGRNLQIAVWASLPLALMLILRQVYFAAGGAGGSLGLALLLEQWAGFADLPSFTRAVLTVFAENFTLFWLWSLILLYFGGRYALNGSTPAALLVVLMWVIVSTLTPAFTREPELGDIPELQTLQPEGMGEMGGMEFMPEMLPNGEQPPEASGDVQVAPGGAIQVLPQRGG